MGKLPRGLDSRLPLDLRCRGGLPVRHRVSGHRRGLPAVGALRPAPPQIVADAE